jgi:hypothetical protein
MLLGLLNSCHFQNHLEQSTWLAAAQSGAVIPAYTDMSSSRDYWALLLLALLASSAAAQLFRTAGEDEGGDNNNQSL